MAKFFRDNGLTIALMLLFLGSLLGHWIAGAHFENQELVHHGQQPISAIAFLRDPLFLSTVFENWESEFLQMSAFVLLTAVLYQKGSAESEDPDKGTRDGRLGLISRNPSARAPLRKGLVVRWIYAHSLGIALFILFLGSFTLHWLFSAKEAAHEAAMHGEVAESVGQYLTSSQLWFESFQNWQSEFLSTAVLVILSIWLRQKDSPESKPVTAPHSQTGA
jgi:glycerol uptake facilitator-like aquaporin